MQQRNLIIFAVLSIFLVGSWYFLIGPPDFSKDDPSKKVAQNNEKDKKKDDNKKPPDKNPEIKPDKNPEIKPDKNPEIKPDNKPEIKKNDPEPEKKTGKEAVALKETLGGDGYHLTVDVTSRGAAVRRVVFNRF